jgi:hypothetical protein
MSSDEFLVCLGGTDDIILERYLSYHDHARECKHSRHKELSHPYDKFPYGAMIYKE